MSGRGRRRDGAVPVRGVDGGDNNGARATTATTARLTTTGWSCVVTFEMSVVTEIPGTAVSPSRPSTGRFFRPRSRSMAPMPPEPSSPPTTCIPQSPSA